MLQEKSIFTITYPVGSFSQLGEYCIKLYSSFFTVWDGFAFDVRISEEELRKLITRLRLLPKFGDLLVFAECADTQAQQAQR